VWTLACCALILQAVRHMSDFAYGAGQQQIIGSTAQPPLEQTRDIWAASVEARRAARQRAIEAGEAAGTPFEEQAEPEVALTPAQRVRRGLRLVLKLWHVLDRAEPLRWVKRMIMFPIGERFAVVSLTAALFTPRVTFIVLLAWGGFAAAYVTLGRLLRTFAR
jgi:hypothetical protein